MIKRFFFLLLFPCLLQSEEAYQLGLQAEDWVASGHYQKAEELYSTLLNDSRPEWQKANATYNLATLYLKQGDYPKASQFFNRVSLHQASSPQLLTRFYLNKGLNALAEAKKYENPHNSIEVTLYKDFLQKGLGAFEKGKELDCELEKLGWPISCLQWDEQIKTIKEEIKKEFSLEEKEDSPPLLLLKQLWLKAFDLTKMIEKEDQFQAQEKELIQRALEFFPLALKDQQSRFSSLDTDSLRCQRKPWDQVFSLFNRGFLSLVTANLSSNKKEERLNEQEKALAYWKEAVDILETPPTLEPEEENESENTLKKLQEMQAQDLIRKEIQTGDRHSW